MPESLDKLTNTEGARSAAGASVDDPALPPASASSSSSSSSQSTATETAPAAAGQAPAIASTPHAGPEKPHEARHGWLDSIQALASTIVIAVFVITFLVQAFQIPSESMERTLLIGDYLLVDKVHFASGGVWGHILPYGTIQRGDIVVFRYPVHPEQHFVKRVIGIPGDRVRLIDKQVYVNEKPVSEQYAIHQAADVDRYRDNFPQSVPSPSQDAHWWVQMRRLVHGGELEVPAGSYFVLGDNRDYSLDSRYWGFVPRENIIGRPLVIYLSLRSPADAGADDKLETAGLWSRLVRGPRWDRTFHIVK